MGGLVLIQFREGVLGEGVNFDEPLSGEEGFDGDFAAIAMGNRMAIGLHFHQCPQFIQFLHHGLTGRKTVLPSKFTAQLIDRAVFIQDRDHR